MLKYLSGFYICTLKYLVLMSNERGIPCRHSWEGIAGVVNSCRTEGLSPVASLVKNSYNSKQIQIIEQKPRSIWQE